MSEFIEWVPKHHGHQPLHWTPDMLTSVDGKNFVRQSSWAWIAGSVYYVPHEAVGLVREDVEPEQTDRTNYCAGCKERQDRIEALTAENERLRLKLKQASNNLKAGAKLHECPGLADAARVAFEALEKQP